MLAVKYFKCRISIYLWSKIIKDKTITPDKRKAVGELYTFAQLVLFRSYYVIFLGLTKIYFQSILRYYFDARTLLGALLAAPSAFNF